MKDAPVYSDNLDKAVGGVALRIADFDQRDVLNGEHVQRPGEQTFGMTSVTATTAAHRGCGGRSDVTFTLATVEAFLEQFSCLNAKCVSQLIQRSQRDVFFAPLDRADVSPVKVRLRPQLFLRPSPLPAQAADGGGDSLARARCNHAGDDPALLVLARQSIPSIVRLLPRPVVNPCTRDEQQVMT